MKTSDIWKKKKQKKTDEENFTSSISGILSRTGRCAFDAVLPCMKKPSDQKFPNLIPEKLSKYLLLHSLSNGYDVASGGMKIL